MTDSIRWNDKGHPLSAQFDDIYFSTENGLAETRYVFLQQNKLKARFLALKNDDNFIIAETGFGTGLNFLAVAELWQQTAVTDAQLDFISVEKYPLDKPSLQRALALWPELAPYSEALLAAYPTIITGFHRIHLPHNITLTLIIEDATLALQQLLISPITLALPNVELRQWRGVDAWFLDGFAPAKNPDMWRPELFTLLGKLSHATTSLATFTAAGIVKRGLTEVGFSLEKIQGYGHKRDMLRGVYNGENTNCDNLAHTAVRLPKRGKQPTATWAAIAGYRAVQKNASIAIIGGGIAGCHTAYSLAQKGYKVTLYEKGKHLAIGSSGNAQGVVYAKLSAHQEALGDVNLYSLLYAQDLYQRYWSTTQHENNSGEACGVLQLSLTSELQAAHQKIAARFTDHDSAITYLSPTAASQIAQTPLAYPALFFPKSGWINPSRLCQWLTEHDNITVISNTEISDISPAQPADSVSHHPQWLLSKRINGMTSEKIKVDVVIIANAQDALHFSQTRSFPMKTVRGQVTHYPASTTSSALATAICGQGYIAPGMNGIHCLGASFNLKVTNTALNPEDHRQNLHNIAQQAPALFEPTGLADNDYHELAGRVGFRCTTPDYLPLVGGVPIESEITSQYQLLKKDACNIIHHAGHYYPNLYINVGHGSRGLAYTPICAEIIASLVHGSPPPLPQTLLQKLSPTRFFIRKIIRS
jgi:tRNA 5-methylaminomethyl-2-thiouridine biosynthesis bifunctional protein